jgi:hypothetical protein
MQINIPAKKNSFMAKVDLYGVRFALLRAVKAVIRKLTGFTWEKCYLMSRTLDEISLPIKNSSFEVRMHTLEYYQNDLWSSFLTPQKEAIYEERFQNENVYAYGVFIDGQLAYSTWILQGEVCYAEQLLFKSSECALLLDSYCLPLFRGKGLHNYMNQWCLFHMKGLGIKKAYVIVLSYNRFAIKTQRRCGLQVEETFYAYKLWGKNRIGKAKFSNKTK